MLAPNGWTASPDPDAIGIVPFTFAGYPFPGGIKDGDVKALYSYFLAQYHTRVESLGHSSGDDWAYAYRPNRNNPSVISIHGTGGAIDVNAETHPNGVRYTLTAAQVRKLRVILKECGGAIKWGGDFSGTPDEQHYELCKSAAEIKRIVAYRRSLPWFVHDLIPVGAPAKWQHGADVYHVQARLGVTRTSKFDVATVDAVKRFQTRLALTANGKVTRGLAYLIG